MISLGVRGFGNTSSGGRVYFGGATASPRPGALCVWDTGTAGFQLDFHLVEKTLTPHLIKNKTQTNSTLFQ